MSVGSPPKKTFGRKTAVSALWNLSFIAVELKMQSSVGQRGKTCSLLMTFTIAHKKGKNKISVSLPH